MCFMCETRKYYTKRSQFILTKEEAGGLRARGYKNGWGHVSNNSTKVMWRALSRAASLTLVSLYQ